LSRLAAPLFLQSIFSYSLSLISIAFVGHLSSPTALSSAVLANSLYNVTGMTVVTGLSAGMETLCGQVLATGACSTAH
jgi:multidrug resistance protein, MATE family